MTRTQQRPLPGRSRSVDVRVVIYGAGAVGSLMGGRLRQSGANVVLVGRPAHVRAIRSGGLTLRSAHGSESVAIDAVTSLAELTPHADDVVIITAKTQDTPPMHDAIVAWSPHPAVVCGTNGVEHERMALRRFEHVYGMLIQMPAQFEKPGEVTVLCGPTNAILDVGRYPTGIDSMAEELAALVDASPHVRSEADANIMVKKYGKLLLNLGNIADAAAGLGGRFADVSRAAKEEGVAVYRAASIEWEPSGEAAASYASRMATMKFDIPDGDTFVGGSTWQSLIKGASSIETDYFTGEILLLARLHGVAVPANEHLHQLAARMLSREIAPGSFTVEQLDAEWDAERPR
jgi:2-dehydropantoate 2-reductase